jgi:hypothetical protein
MAIKGHWWVDYSLVEREINVIDIGIPSLQKPLRCYQYFYSPSYIPLAPFAYSVYPFSLPFSSPDR